MCVTTDPTDCYSKGTGVIVGDGAVKDLSDDAAQLVREDIAAQLAEMTTDDNGFGEDDSDDSD